AFADVKDAQLQAELKAAVEPAAQAMIDMQAWLQSQHASATNDYALGPELFAKMLEMTERVTTPLDRLEAIGQTDLDRNLAALADACERLAPKQTIAACIADRESTRLNSSHVKISYAVFCLQKK